MDKEFSVFCEEMVGYNQIIRENSQSAKHKKLLLEKQFQNYIKEIIGWYKDEYVRPIVKMVLECPNLVEIYGQDVLSLMQYIAKYWEAKYLCVLRSFCRLDSFRLFLENKNGDKKVADKLANLMVFITSCYDVKDTEEDMALIKDWVPGLKETYPAVFKAVKKEIERLMNELADFGCVPKEQEMLDAYGIDK